MSDTTEHYRFADELPLTPIRPGSTVLVSGEKFSNAENLARTMVVGGTAHDEGVLLISTNMSSQRLVDACREAYPSLDSSLLGVLDCTGQDIGTTQTDVEVKYVSTQSDLTGMGMKFSSLYEALYGRATEGRVRVGLFSLSSLSMYVELRLLFRFAQTLSGRIETAGGLGVFTINPAANDDKTVSTLEQVADGKIEVRDADSDADGELRTRGLSEQPTEWTPFTLP